jgi:hypothetical protein
MGAKRSEKANDRKNGVNMVVLSFSSGKESCCGAHYYSLIKVNPLITSWYLQILRMFFRS